MRRPFNRPTKITGDAASHGAYNVGPASDYALGRGEFVYAPFDMTLTPYRSATGGWALAGTGDAICNLQHLIDESRRTGWVKEGTPIAQVAGKNDSPGSMWAGDHLHTWIIVAGQRMDFEQYVAWRGFQPVKYGAIAPPTLTSAAGGGTSPSLTTEGTDMRKLWKYTSSDPDTWVVIDHLNMTYRLIPPGSLEAGGIDNDVAAGLRFDEISDPEWGRIFGNGQFRQVSKPDPIGGGTGSGASALVVEQIVADSEKRIIDATPTADENGAAARKYIVAK